MCIVAATLLIVLLFHPLRSVASPPPVALRDVSVKASERTATITFLISGKAATVVLEPKGKGWAQVRMKSMKADKGALSSAAIHPGIRSVRARIERTDVLVTDVHFTREVLSMQITRRDAGRVEVRVSLGKPISGKPPASARRTSPPSTGTGRKRWALSTIVIDAGHGGKDPGAIGLKDVREKDITLAVARGLRDEIKRGMPGVKVVMTRSTDKFVGLAQRGRIANANNGRLFISIHCNSMPHKPHPASGFECYILRPGKSDDAVRVATAENGSIKFEEDRSGGNSETEESIVATMAQSAFARYSEQAADAIRAALRKRISIPDRGVHQAGFYVLVGASMPAVLVEIGYISNETDVKLLSSKSGQKKIARALYDGVREFEKSYAESLR